MASLYNIQVRTGCFCNTGACQRHLGISDEMVKKHLQVGSKPCVPHASQQDPGVVPPTTLEAGHVSGVGAGSFLCPVSVHRKRGQQKIENASR